MQNRFPTIVPPIFVFRSSCSDRLIVRRRRQVGGVRVGGVNRAVAQQPVEVPCAVALQHIRR